MILNPALSTLVRVLVAQILGDGIVAVDERAGRIPKTG
jgi:hypothetical protein